MPAVSSTLQNARGAVGDRFNTIKEWLEPADIEAVAADCGLKVGTVKQIKKGVKWNTVAVALLIQKAEARKAYYEELAGSPLDDESGEPLPASQADETPDKSKDVRRRSRKPAKTDKSPC
jgi:hypothetical protein